MTKARTKKAKRAATPRKAKTPEPAVGAVKWLLRSGGKDVPVAEWARQPKPFDVRQALRRTITDGPRVVTQAELDKALKAPKQTKRK